MKATIKTKEGLEFTGELIEKKPKRPRAERGGRYYCADVDGSVRAQLEDFDKVDNFLFETGNYYLTKDQAEKEGRPKVEKEKAIQRIKDYILENDMYFEPNWEDDEEIKWAIQYCHEEEEFFSVNYLQYLQLFSPFGYLAKKEHTDQIMKDCEEDLKIIFDIKR